MKPETSFLRRFGWLLLLLLSAVFLRFYNLAGTPPGITHDEADHGITALEIVEGAREIYFTVGYGREPLFDYSTAAVMALLGPSYLAARLTAVYFGLIFTAGSYAWVRSALDKRIALLTSMGIAVGFWPVMTSRQSLRSITLPALFALVLTFFWMGLKDRRLRIVGKKISPFGIGGLLLGLTFYTYIPARLLWLLFPLLAGYAMLIRHPLAGRIWRGTAWMLLIAAIVGSPLFYYLASHPDAELRIRQLSAPVSAAAEGEFAPLIRNAVGSLGVITFSGDTHWRYNIPGRPFLQPVMGALFYLGLATLVWRLFRPSNNKGRLVGYMGALLCLLLGLAPALITGPELSTTQSIGMQPALYLFPALGLVMVYELGRGRVGLIRWQRIGLLAVIMLFAGTAMVTARDYFMTWADAPEARVQYETTTIAALAYLRRNEVSAAVISTINPGRFHSPAVSQMMLPNKEEALRWIDGRHSMLLPREAESLLMVPGFTALPAELTPYLETAVLVETLSLRETDLDRPISVYALDGPRMLTAWEKLIDTKLDEMSVPVDFGQVAQLLGFDLITPLVKAGDVAKFSTMWRVIQPVDDVILFTHIQGADGLPIAQADRLDVPSRAWHSGDTFVQLHRLVLPLDAPAGSFPLVVGLCRQRPDGCIRLPISAAGSAKELLQVTSLTIAQ